MGWNTHEDRKPGSSQLQSAIPASDVDKYAHCVVLVPAMENHPAIINKTQPLRTQSMKRPRSAVAELDANRDPHGRDQSDQMGNTRRAICLRRTSNILVHPAKKISLVHGNIGVPSEQFEDRRVEPARHVDVPSFQTITPPVQPRFTYPRNYIKHHSGSHFVLPGQMAPYDLEVEDFDVLERLGISEEEMETTMAAFEFAAAEIPPKNGTIQGDKLDTEQWCEVCNLAGSETNKLYRCSGCSIQVHSHCYGLQKPVDQFLCDLCRDASAKPQYCALCPNPASGAMRMAVDAGRKKWVHVLCGAACPEARPRYMKTSTASVIGGLEDVPWSRWHKSCCFCTNLHGVTLECPDPQCTKRFHASCARKHGGVVVRDSTAPFAVVCFCSKQHQPWPGELVASQGEVGRSRRRGSASDKPLEPSLPLVKLEAREFCLRDHISAQELFRSDREWQEAILTRAAELGAEGDMRDVFEHWLRRRKAQVNGLPLLREYCRDLHDDKTSTCRKKKKKESL